MVITSAVAKVMFPSLSVACLFVCLPVSNITQKRLNRFSWNCQRRWDLIQGIIGNIFRMFHSTPGTQDFSPLFRSNPCLLAELQKTVEQIFMKFSENDGHGIGSNLEHVTVNPLNPGSIHLFPGSVFLILWKNGWTDFHEIFTKRQTWHKT